MAFVTGIRRILITCRRRRRRLLDRIAAVCPRMAILVAAWLVASPSPSATRARAAHGRIHDRVVMAGRRPGPGSQLTKRDISPYSGRTNDAELQRIRDLVAESFASDRLRVSGLVEVPGTSPSPISKRWRSKSRSQRISASRAGPESPSGAGSHARHSRLAKPAPEARYAVFYSLADGADGGRDYDVHKIENMRHELTILAYEMNGAPVSVLTARRCGYAARTSWASRWSSGSRQSSSSMTSLISARARAATMRTMSSTATGCRFDCSS